MALARQRVDVIVVGGGSVGAATALGLRQQGWEVALVERRPRPRFDTTAPVTRVAVLNSASLGLLEQLEVVSDLRETRMHGISRMCVWDAHSDAQLEFDADALGLPALGWTAEHLELEALAWNQLEREGVTLFPGQEWRHIELCAGYRALHLSDRILEARLVVAADGAESRLREQSGIAVRRKPYGVAVVATVRTRFPHEDSAWQRFNGDEILAFLPLQDGRCSIVWSVPEYRADQLQRMESSEFADCLASALGQRLGAVEESSPRFQYPLVGRQAQEYGQRRLVLIGDAAHTIHPLAGQGLNLGFADVSGLLAVLGARLGADPGADPVLQDYTRKRRIPNEFALRSMEQLRWWFGSAGSGHTTLRRIGVTWVNESPSLKRFFAHRAVTALW
jgi:2-octaprenylphenol hydroxylase